jgi:gliding motility-associated lipoprotein GldD
MEYRMGLCAKCLTIFSLMRKYNSKIEVDKNAMLPTYYQSAINKSALCFFIIVGLITSCSNDEATYSPKPRGYFRIDFPKKEYRLYDSICPYTFEIPLYTQMVQDKHMGAEPCWLNLEYKQFNATLHLSYKAVNKNIATYLEDAHNFANKHQVKATGLDEIVIIKDSAKVYGLLFDIAGNTASSLQFYLTDSTQHFLRGALYFNAAPNSDSLKIVVDFIKQDVMHLINTTRWKE